ncbi:choline/glycine/proline betaine transport protein [Altererythrobacter xiamenensis]|uniref:Choline/glycine/proline betaine transport protein n=1 Tax=Altererythrobacter xiamenensis TaxID=1316679 RepID=A0A1Y6EAK6_9SPHN|nr:BCCT family transporter [Altererythrobacter xiamenensis]SMQ57662.1 choline/glycine/proline betaine transport protein [Altererythrobacter xiamenensis]
MSDPVLTEAAPVEESARIKVNPPVFYISAGLILAFALFGALAPDQAGQIFSEVQAYIVRDFGWLYVSAVAGFLLFVVYLMLSRHGDIKLGPDESEPDYSYLSWFAMLFSAGMGIGLVFFGVAEPIQHYASPPTGEGGTVDSARRAMTLTFFHWGLHAWAIYIVVGLSLAYFSFRRGLPLTIRSALYPLIGHRIDGPIGHAIDIFAVLGTMFGVATSLGLGVLQVNAGFAYLFDIPIAAQSQLILIAVITLLATLSVFLGLDKGVKRLSELNIILAILLLGFVLFSGSTIFLLQAFVQNVGTYLGEVIPRTFRMYAYDPNPWLADWTLFYWGWWIAWSPFVGMFIARISRGRTIREFVGGVLLVPVLFTFLWMTVFGNTAISLDLAGTAPIAQTVADNLPVALFATLAELPLEAITSLVATFLIITFFITSADSGALVIDMITSGAAKNPPVWQRIFWAVCAGAIAAVLLVAGGLQALQTAAIASALPFAVIMIFICYGLYRGLGMESEGTSTDLMLAPTRERLPELTWQQRLTSIMGHFGQKDIHAFIADTAGPAMEAVSEQMRESGFQPEMEQTPDCIEITVPHGERGAFRYTVRSRPFLLPSFVWAESRKEREEDPRHYRAMAHTSEGETPHDVTGFSRDQLINDLLNRYARFRHSRRIA